MGVPLGHEASSTRNDVPHHVGVVRDRLLMEGRHDRSPTAEVLVFVGEHERSLAYQWRDDCSTFARMKDVSGRPDDGLDAVWL